MSNKRKKFEFKVIVDVPQEATGLLKELVEAGIVDDIREAAKAVADAIRDFIPKFKFEVKEVKEDEQKEEDK